MFVESFLGVFGPLFLCRFFSSLIFEILTLLLISLFSCSIFVLSFF